MDTVVAVLGIPGWFAVWRRLPIAAGGVRVTESTARVLLLPRHPRFRALVVFRDSRPLCSKEPLTFGLAKKAAVFLCVRSLVVGDVVLARCHTMMLHCRTAPWNYAPPPVPCTCV